MDNRELVRGIVEKLSRKVTAENRAVVRHNIDLIKTVLECWGGRLRDNGVDPHVVFDLFQRLVLVF